MPVHHTEDTSITRAAPAVAAVTAAADAPAGGTGATAGAWDTAGHRDSAITTINQLRADVIALQATVNSLVTKLKAIGHLS